MSGYRRGSSNTPDDSENLNPEDVHRSLRSTANAIQNYSFDYSPARFGGLDDTRMGKLDLVDGSKGSPTLEDKMSLLELSSGENGGHSRLSPTKTDNNNGVRRSDENSAKGAYQ